MPIEVALKLIVAATLSLIIGFERELKRKPVGLKTSLVIATFSCLLTIISIETAYNTPARPDINITMDPLRLAAQIVSGIGFLGAGVILRKGNDSITGLTTAAMIWGAAGIGIAVGAGFYWQAVLGVIIVVGGIELVTPFLMKIGPKRMRQREVIIQVTMQDSAMLTKLIQYLESERFTIQHMRISDRDTYHTISLKLSTNENNTTLPLYKALHELPYIENVDIEFVI
ncbi:MgtC/SapB family protein [Lysinibacillus alkalisoli]|nr:MgtC/SapB family protein [Lysinibacillus alkalisoli]